MQRREKQMMRYKASTTLTAATVIPATLLSVLLVVLGKHAGHEADLMYLRIAGYYIPMTIGGFTVAILMAVQGKKLIDRSYWKYALRFSLPLIPEVLSIQIMNQADKLMVTRITGDIPPRQSPTLSGFWRIPSGMPGCRGCTKKLPATKRAKSAAPGRP